VVDLLFRSFEEHSIVWIILSAGVGGLIGATIDFLLQNVLTSRMQSSKAARDAINRYKYPLIQSVESLRKLIELLFQFVEANREDMITDEYFKLSYLYTFGRFLALSEIIEDTAIFKYEPSSSRTKKLHINFYGVFKAMTNFSYYQNIEEIPVDRVRAVTVPRLYLKAIGEIMVDRTVKESGEPGIPIGFVKFTTKYYTDKAFAQWFEPLVQLLDASWQGKQGLAWSRLVLLTTKLNVLSYTLDPRGKYTGWKSIRRLDDLHPEIRKRIVRELEIGKMVRLIQKESNDA